MNIHTFEVGWAKDDVTCKMKQNVPQINEVLIHIVSGALNFNEYFHC